ncbi:COBW domain-containing protein 2 [Gracilariopsis chorda]|uniref:COBW domain-containing protein 2 n=1 Tax=Gracilariopsis chorda TaxID=448386 RepID=A0A2V3IS63_9FLOR|nr:COBW domain-containing protein 2 [Gracilariopsis chorda]|eukprot:PXF44965.1 COBW domain-containing protein 2 [Gracilariopsis chorda]
MDKERGAFDHSLIKASEIAGPGSMVSWFWVDEERDSALYLDTVVVVVDCVNLQRFIGDEGMRIVAGKQIAIADAVLLTKWTCCKMKQRGMKETVKK